MSRLVAAELLKLRTIRSPYLLVLAILVVSALAAAGSVGAGFVEGELRELTLADAAESSGIVAILLGVLLVTNEYRHGTIAATFLVTPARERAVGAKVAAGGLVGVATGATAAVASLAVAVPWLSSRGSPLALDWPLASAQLRLLAVFVLSAVLGVAVGAIVRSQVGAIVLVFVWFLVVEPLLGLLGFALTRFERDLVGPYLPGNAIDAVVSPQSSIEPEWLGAPLAVLYAAALVALAFALTLRRDAV